MFKVRVSSNAEAVGARFANGARTVDSIVTLATNKTMERVQAAAPREIRKVGYNFPAGLVASSITLQEAGFGTQQARLLAKGGPVPLIAFDARSTATGVSVEVLNGRKHIKGAFIARISGGRAGVFLRDAGTGARQQRELYGPSVRNALDNPQVRANLARVYRDEFPRMLLSSFKDPSIWLP